MSFTDNFYMVFFAYFLILHDVPMGSISNQSQLCFLAPVVLDEYLHIMQLLYKNLNAFILWAVYLHKFKICW